MQTRLLEFNIFIQQNRAVIFAVVIVMLLAMYFVMPTAIVEAGKGHTVGG